MVSAVLEYTCIHSDMESFSPIWDDLLKNLQMLRKNLISNIQQATPERNMMTFENFNAIIRVLIGCIHKRNDENMLQNSSHQETAKLTESLCALLEDTFYVCIPYDCQATILDLLSAAWKYYGNENIFSSQLSPLISSTVVNSDSLLAVSKLSNVFLPLVSRPIATQTLAPALLRAAVKQSSDNFEVALILVHAVASLHDEDNDSDDFIFVDNAKQCVSADDDLSPLINMCVAQKNIDNSLTSFIARCLPFLVISSRSSHRDCYEELSLNWLLFHLEQSEQVLNKSFSNDSCVAYGIYLEAFSVICHDGLTARPSSKHSKVKKMVKKIRHLVESVALIGHHSVFVMKGTASYVKVSRVASLHFTENADNLFEVLVTNLRSPNHYLRMHTLNILDSFPTKPYVVDHGDVDFYDDLDEESTNPRSLGSKATQMHILSGPCPMIKHLLGLECIPISFQNERQFLSELNRVEVLGRSGKIPIEYAEAAANLMFGTFHIKFSSIWSAAKKVLIAIAEKYEEAVWVPLQFYLKEAMKVEDNSTNGSTFETETNCISTPEIIRECFTTCTIWESSCGKNAVAFQSRLNYAKCHGQVSYHQRTDSSAVFRLVWEVMASIPQVTSKKSRVVVPLFFAFLNEQYYTAYSEDSDARELRLNEFTSELGPM